MECIDAEELLAFYEGHLSAARREGVEVHLDGCPACREELAELARSEEGSEQGWDPSLPPGGQPSAGERLEAGAPLGRYVLLHPVGQGGMGEVWAAWDPALDRRVALKVLREDLGEASTGGQALLRREALIMARLAHPGVVGVFDVGVVGGRAFVAMEFIAGPTLSAYARGRPWGAVLAALEQAGRGLAAAHRAGIVHRDFKPSNVLVGADGAARVTDFGLARQAWAAAGAPPPGAAALPAPATTLAGTSGYIAPELLAGAPPSPASDQYAFCVTARQLLPPLGLPPWVAPIFERGLCPAPSGRWPSMDALLAEVEVRRARQRWLRWGGGLAAAVLGVALGAGALHAAALSRCHAQASTLERPFRAERQAAIRGGFVAATGEWGGQTWDHLAGPLQRWVEAWGEERSRACMDARGASGEALELAARRVGCLEERRAELEALLGVFEGGGRPVVEEAVEVAQALPPPSSCADAVALRSARPVPADPTQREQAEALRRRMAAVDVRRQAGLYQQAVGEAAALLPEVQALGYAPLTAEGHHLVGQAELSRGDFRAAERSLLEAVYLSEASRHDSLLARAWISLAPLLTTLERAAPVIEHARRQARAAVQRLGEDPDQRWELLVAEGRIADHAHHNEQALRLYLAAREVLEARGGRAGVKLAAIHTFIGGIYGRLRDRARALASFARALEIYRDLYGEQHPRVATATSNYARQLMSLGRFEESLPLNQRAMEVGARTFPPLHPTLSSIGLNLGVALRELGRPQEALPVLRGAVEAARTVQDEESAMLHTTQEALSEVLLELGRAEEVLELSAGAPEGLSVRLLALRVAALLDLGRWEEAAALLPLHRARSLDPARRSNFDRVLAEHNTARLSAARGEVDAALATLRALEGYMRAQEPDPFVACRMAEALALHTDLAGPSELPALVASARAAWEGCLSPRLRARCQAHSRRILEQTPGQRPLTCP